MGFLSDLVGTFTGSTARDASKAQIEEAERSKQFIQKGINEAKTAVDKYGQGARQSQGQGFQGALDIFSQTLPQQAGLFQQGNMGAQQALLSGLPQMNNAILGRQVDYNAMQPQQFDYNMDFSQGNQAVGYQTPEQQAAQQQSQFDLNKLDLSNLLTGTIGGQSNGYGGLGANISPSYGGGNNAFLLGGQFGNPFNERTAR